MRVVARAPGKVVLLGEYAVLAGAPALVAAVNRRAVAEVSSVASGPCVLDAPDIWPDAVPFKLDGRGRVCWMSPDAGTRLGLVTAVVEALAAGGRLPAVPWHLRIDSSAFFEKAGAIAMKLGLGSSAAVTVTCASALAVYAGHAERVADREAWLRELLGIHRRFQGGRGSGLDIAASLYGGERIFRVDDGTPVVEAFAWPAGLERLYVWSGHSASTARFLVTLETWRHAQPHDHALHMAALAEAARRGVAAVRVADPHMLRCAIGAMADGLRAFGQASKIPVFSMDHEVIAGIVATSGGTYKPCGAGGGDLGMAVVAGAAARRRLVEALCARGYGCVALETDPDGLVCQVET